MSMLRNGFVGLFLASVAIADDATAGARLTFTKDVQPILQENCLICHRHGGDQIAGMVAPMSLDGYEEVRPWAKAMAKVVAARQMPPWDASDASNGVFANERRLSEDQIATIVRWVESGASRGNPVDAPAPKVFEDKGGWVIGQPDLIVRLDKPYFVKDDIADDQPDLTITITKEMLPEPRWIQAIECKPDSEVVHHIVGMATAPPYEGRPQEQFSAGSIAAGEDPIMYPPEFGNLLRAGTKIHLSMHYHKEVGPGTGVWDQSAVGFKFHPKDAVIKYNVHRGGIANASFEIPPHQPDWKIGAGEIFAKDTLILALHPHMHFRGKSMVYTAYYPDGTTELLLDVNRYEYEWQTNYIYKQPKLIPAGTRIDVMTVYDNSAAAKEKYPVIDIEKPVRFGAPSTDEMMIPFLDYAELDAESANKFRATGTTGD
ncbi:MAG: hypothetical protein AAB353_06000 [Candidatus Hydrogenedentota bacterium]